MVRKQYKLLDFQPETGEQTKTQSKKASPDKTTQPELKMEPETKSELKSEEKSETKSETKSEAKPKLTYTAEEIFESDDRENPHMPRAEVRARRDIYEKVKQRVKGLEKNNTSKMIVFRDYRVPWFKAGGNSAIYYAFDIAGKLGKRNINLNVDKDGHAVFHEGVVSFHGIKNLLDNMIVKADFAQPKILADGWILVFDLKHEYSKAELRAMRNTSKERRRKLNELVLPENNYPTVYYQILTVIKRISPQIFKLSPHHRQAFSQMTEEKLLELHYTYLQLANGRLEIKVAVEKMQDIMTWLTSLMKVMLESNFWDVSVCAPIGQALADLADEIEEKIINRED